MLGRPARAAVPALVLLLASVLGQGCVTMFGRRTQAVIVTARPAGARVLVDGKPQGITPLALRLAKKPPHVIRIEKDGYRPVEIRLKKRKNWPAIIFPNLIWSVLAFGPAAASGIDPQDEHQENVHKALVILFYAAWPAAMLVDGLSAKSNMIEPRHLNIALEKDSGGGVLIIIPMDPAEFRNITWISVLDDGGATRR